MKIHTTFEYVWILGYEYVGCNMDDKKKELYCLEYCAIKVSVKLNEKCYTTTLKYPMKYGGKHIKIMCIK